MPIYKAFPALAAATLVSTLGVAEVDAAVLLTTGFTGMSINGTDPNQADGIVWTENGMSGPSSLSLENVVVFQNDGELMDTGTYTTANGYFGAYTNVGQGGAWGTTVSSTIGVDDVSLESISIEIEHSSSAGGLNSNTNYRSFYTATVTDTSDNSVVDTITSAGFNPYIGTNTNGNILTLTFGTPLTLDAGGTYEIAFLVTEDNSSGHYVSFDELAFTGEVVPEPGSLALLGLGGLMMIKRRRR